MMKKSIKTAIIVPLLIALIVGIAAMAAVVSILSSNTVSNLTNSNIETSVSLYTEEFNALCLDVYGAVAAVAPVVEDSLNTDITREITDARGYNINLLSDVLAANSNIFGIWTAWEPNAFDGQDSVYAATSFYDETGRFVPYIVRDGNSVSVSALVDYDDPVAGEYYQGAFTTGKPYMTDPYPYDVDGQEVLMCSIAIPVLRDGAAVGAVGVDLNLNSFIETMNASSILGDGYLFVVAPGGIIATHPNQELIMQDYNNITWIKEYASEFKQILESGGKFEGEALSDVLQENMQFQCEGVAIGDTGRYWLVCGIVPEKTVTSAVNQLLLVIIIIGAALFVVVGVVAYTLTSRSLAPLAPLTAFLRRAGGEGDIVLNQEDAENIRKFAQKPDELGQCIAGTAGFVEQVNRVSDVLETIADGDLTVKARLLSDKDKMGISLNKMTESLNSMFRNINAASSQVSTGASQVADGAQTLAQGATQQAASVEELSSSVSEINGMAKENTENATGALTEVQRTEQLMAVCMEQMDQMMAAMQAIDEKSQNITKTTKVIDDIAFQTNILALNAAVEAARAGQHGKGFAVVAEEVRNLASKSAEAAKETETLIESSSLSVEEGNRIVAKVNESLQAVAEIAQKNAEHIAKVQAVSAHQSEAMGHVNIGIDQIAKVVQQNSATAEESAAASEEMSGQSAMLRELISQFRLKN